MKRRLASRTEISRATREPFVLLPVSAEYIGAAGKVGTYLSYRLASGMEGEKKREKELLGILRAEKEEPEDTSRRVGKDRKGELVVTSIKSGQSLEDSQEKFLEDFPRDFSAPESSAVSLLHHSRPFSLHRTLIE